MLYSGKFFIPVTELIQKTILDVVNCFSISHLANSSLERTGLKVFIDSKFLNCNLVLWGYEQIWNLHKSFWTIVFIQKNNFLFRLIKSISRPRQEHCFTRGLWFIVLEAIYFDITGTICFNFLKLWTYHAFLLLISHFK